MTHVMEKTPRVITKIGLVLEFIGSALAFGAYFMLDKLLSSEFILELDPTTTTEELEIVELLVPFITVMLLVVGIASFIMFIINFYLFRGLYTERYNEEKARKIYTYQFILGIVYLFVNTVVGILYVVSGNQGRSGQKDMPYTREGI
jgi:hypothetical protein